MSYKNDLRNIHVHISWLEPGDSWLISRTRTRNKRIFGSKSTKKICPLVQFLFGKDAAQSRA